MSHFQTALVAEAVDGGWRLHAPLVYYSDVLGRTVTVPAGIALIWRVSPEYSGG
jgi:hypothetical protein